MEVPNSICDAFPEYEETFFQIKAHLLGFEKCKISEMFPKHNEIVLSRTVHRFTVYIQTVLHRILDLSHGIIQSWESGNIGSAFVLLRALDENISVVYDANIRLEKLIKMKDFDSIYKLIFNLQYGTRDKKVIKEFVEKELKLKDSVESLKVTEEELVKVITSQQILDVMDGISEKIPNHRDYYEYLCEYAHPNYNGLIGLYGFHNDKFTILLSKENGITNENVSKFFPYFETFLKMFAEGHDGIVHKLNAITELSNEDLRCKGRDTEIYKSPIV